MLFLLILVLVCFQSFALQYPYPLATDPRIKLIQYDENDIHVFNIYYDQQSSLLFEEGESIQTISMGNPAAWMINPIGNRLFIKPIDDKADTNATIITSLRTYHIELHAGEAEGLRDERLSYEIRFVYSDAYNNNLKLNDISRDIDTNDFEGKNFNYMVSGSDLIAPILAFDDGIHTYVKFKNVFPAIFSVDRNGRESVVNFQVRGYNMVSIEKINAVFTLRYGDEVACLFNESIKYKTLGVQKRSRGIFFGNKNKRRSVYYG